MNLELLSKFPHKTLVDDPFGLVHIIVFQVRVLSGIFSLIYCEDLFYFVDVISLMVAIVLY